MDTILEVKNLIKDYGSYRAVDDISFSMERGKVVGFLGPNGAGKTTTIQILCGITLPTNGQIYYFGKDFSKHREDSLQRINFASAFNTLQGRISVLENLLVFADLYAVKDAKRKSLELLEYFEIENLKNTLYQNLSAGQKTRVNLVKSLLNDPEILLLDEPTASLDPDIADKTLTLVEELKNNRKISILYTSHDMDEITRVCDEVIFLDHGKIIARDTPLGLTKRIGKATLRVTFDGKKEDIEKYLLEKEYKFLFHGRNVVEITSEEKLIPKIIFGLSNNNIWLTDIEVNKPTLEDFFLQIARGGIDVN
ncbi:MAG TPA: ABC transporter ATP-binding protein [Patescibacteria group bacterium]